MTRPTTESIERRLPIAVGVLFLVVLVGFAVVARHTVETALREAAATRLASVSSRLAGTLAASVPAQIANLASIARSPPVFDHFRNPDAPREAAGRALDSVVAATPAMRALLARPGHGSDLLAGLPDDTVYLGGASPGVGGFVESGDTVGYALTVPVVDGRDTLGTLSEIRVLSGSPEAAGLIAGLIGADATFIVGTPETGVWTDLATSAPGPGVEGRPGEMLSARAGGGVALGVLRPIEGTPWTLWVALPSEVVSGPLANFTTRMGVVVGILVLAGAAGAWLLGRSLTRPLVRLTSAAEAVAAGDYSRRIATERHDEVGRLANAFDVMSEKVAESWDRMEERVAERTGELQTALEELETAQEELVRKERLALLGALAGGVGHELRNPLGVMTNAVFYLDAVLADHSQNVTDYLDILRKQIGISEKIVGDLLDFARIKPPRTEATRIGTLVQEQLHRAVPPDEVEIHRDFPEDLPAARVDPGQVGQVVLNLITNAVQAMKGPGTLTLRGRSEDGMVRLEVEDTGPGIDEDTIGRIFEPLFTTRARGIGLGLSVSRSLVEANGGRLSVTSEPGQGATFVLRLPALETP